MREPGSWMGTPRAAGFMGGIWCWAAAALALHHAAPSAPLGAALLRWLAGSGPAPELIPLAIAALVVTVHAVLIREAGAPCCREWLDAAWSVGAVAAGIAAWSWALHYEPFSDPVSGTRRLAALAGLAAMLVGTGITLATAAAAERERWSPPSSSRSWWRRWMPIG